MLCSRRTIFALAAALAAGVAPVLGQPATPAPPKSADPPADPFGEEVTLPEKNIIYFSGTGNWDSAFETIVDAFKTVNAFLAKQDVDQAIGQYEKATTIRPDDYIAHYNLANALQQKGQTGRAAREYEKAQALKPPEKP